MKILVVANDPRERTLIDGALAKGKHEVSYAETTEQALGLIGTDRPRLMILDDQIAGAGRADFVAHVRASGQPHIYILSLAAAGEPSPDSDDTIRKPFTSSDLAARLLLAGRFVALGDSLSEARDQIEGLAIYEPLTGLMNRGAFLRTAQGELERARRTVAPLSVIAMDLDGLQALNQQQGNEAGDTALKAVAQTIREKSRPYDCIGRWADDEFLLALPGVIGEDAEKIADRIIKGVQATEVEYNGRLLTLGLSAGIASQLNIGASTELQPLIDRARQAMARAKEMGGNQIYLSYA